MRSTLADGVQPVRPSLRAWRSKAPSEDGSHGLPLAPHKTTAARDAATGEW